jgi:hypothetical protein
MPLSTYIIDYVTQTGDIRFAGRFKGEPTSKTRQIIVRQGGIDDDLIISQGTPESGGFELDITLPSLTYAMFASATLVGKYPAECRFDQGVKPTEFDIDFVLGKGAGIVTTTFSFP